MFFLLFSSFVLFLARVRLDLHVVNKFWAFSISQNPNLHTLRAQNLEILRCLNFARLTHLETPEFQSDQMRSFHPSRDPETPKSPTFKLNLKFLVFPIPELRNPEVPKNCPREIYPLSGFQNPRIPKLVFWTVLPTSKPQNPGVPKLILISVFTHLRTPEP